MNTRFIIVDRISSVMKEVRKRKMLDKERERRRGGGQTLQEALVEPSLKAYGRNSTDV
jgi:hypothetical protein